MRSNLLILVSVVLFAGQGAAFSQGVGEPRGLRLKCEGATPGYTLFSPLNSETTYLVDLDGRAVRTWKSGLLPSAWVYMLDNGHVMRGGSDPGSTPFRGGGQGGRFQEFDFDGNLVWDFRYNNAGRLPHHDVSILPNGNILAIVWESKTANETRRAGRRPQSVPNDGIWPDMLIEFEPQRPSGAKVVWEWHIWDHLIQNTDPALDNFDDPARRPERIDINADTPGNGVSTHDVFHTNSVAYNPDLDQILISVPTFNEVWVIDHSTSTSEASGGTGGRYGKGGDLLYRWGNPQAYGRGTEADRRFGFQHNAHWILPDRPGAGHMMVFSNKAPNGSGTVSRVYEFVPGFTAGHYPISATGAYGPAEPVWTYSTPDLQAINVSGAERMKNGNTLISLGPQGRLFEVTPSGDIVWEYWSPYSGSGIPSFTLFRAEKISADHPALAGRSLQPLNPQPSTVGPISPGTGSCPMPSLPAPTLSEVYPSSSPQGSRMIVTFTGTNFVLPAVIDAGLGVEVSDIKATSAESYTATFVIAADAAPGLRGITIRTAGGTSNAVPLTVLLAPPVLTNIVPQLVARGGTAPWTVTLNGANFVSDLTLVAGSGIHVSELHVIDPTKATAKLIADSDASLGLRDASVVTSGGTSAPAALRVVDPFPDLSIVSSHTGNFAAGFREKYAVNVTNEGAVSTNGAITVSDSLPDGLLFVSAAGSGWECSASGQTVTCGRTAILNAGDSTGFTLTVDVSGSAPVRVDHHPSVTVDGDWNDANNSASDVTTIVSPSPQFTFTPDPLIPGQPARVDITMPSAFPHEVTGSVTMEFTSNAAIPVDDPAMQFSTGGRSVSFTIPANGTEARFGSAAQPGTLAFQAGTVAGTLTFRGTFTSGTLAGGFSPGAGTPAVPLQAPSIKTAEIRSESGSEVSILLLSTSREVTQLSLSFHTSPKVQLSCNAIPACAASGNNITLDVSSQFLQWFSSDAVFGGLAQLRLPLTIAGGNVTGTVDVTLRNKHGVSNLVSFPLR